jgi:transcriptional regulator with XRE-family HTH domain
MKFCERLKLAREHAKLTQQELIDRLPLKSDGKPLMAQSNLAKMEKSQNAKGSIYSVFIAEVCGVNPKWLANEVGEMFDYSIKLNNELKTHLMVMQNLPDYARTEVIRDAIKTAELITKATTAAKENGTKTQ